MKVAVSTDGNQVSAHFGRCPLFTIAEGGDGREIRKSVINNPGHHPGFLPEFLKKQGVEVIIAGGMGRRAQDLFSDAGIRVIVGAPEAEPHELAEAFLAGRLQTGDNICDH